MSAAPHIGLQYRKRVVGIGEMIVSKKLDDCIVTYALGSCLGITVYDPGTKVGGLLHIMLPITKLQQEDAKKNPLRYVETGVPMLFKACYALGAEKSRMIIRVAGGANAKILSGANSLKIGKRNIIALKRLLLKNNVLIANSDVGGTKSRTLSLVVGSGHVDVLSQGQKYELSARQKRQGVTAICP